MTWKGWKFVIDGKERQAGSKIVVDSGIHFFEIFGNVPVGTKGDLPLTVLQGQSNLVEKGRIVAIDGVFGVREYHTPGANSWDKPYTYSHRLISPNREMYDGMSMPIPYSMKQIFFMKVNADGEYSVTGNTDNRFRIRVNGVMTFDNMVEVTRPTIKKVTLRKGVATKIEIEQRVEGVPAQYRQSSVFLQGPGMDKPELADYDMFYPMD
jgi:hypothetical protein